MDAASGDAALIPPHTEALPTNPRVVVLRMALDAVEKINRENGPTEHSLETLKQIAHTRSVDDDPELGHYLTELCSKARKFHCVKASLARQLLFDVEENRLKHQYEDLRAWLFGQISTLQIRLQQASR